MTQEQQIKLAFAYEWLKQPTNAYAAALIITQRDTFAAMKMMDAWSHDPEVIQFKKDLIEQHGEDHFLPTKAEMCRDLIEQARTDPFADMPKNYKLVAEMRGFIEKAGITINNSSTTNNKVMVVPAQLNANGTVDEDAWENKAIAQQAKIVEGQVV